MVLDPLRPVNLGLSGASTQHFGLEAVETVQDKAVRRVVQVGAAGFSGLHSVQQDLVQDRGLCAQCQKTRCRVKLRKRQRRVSSADLKVSDKIRCLISYYLEGLDVRESLFVADVRCDDFDLLFREFVQHFRVSIRYSDVGLGKVKGFV